MRPNVEFLRTVINLNIVIYPIILENMTSKKLNGLFVVWKQYQRRAEVLAPLINVELRFTPHLFKSKYFRPLDYLIKLADNINYIVRHKPKFIIAQCPPIFSVIPALITGVPYIIDAHNPLFQVEMWQKIPFAKYLIKNSQAVIVHNSEMAQLVKKLYPSVRLFDIADPIEFIDVDYEREIKEKQILVIASFDPWDEPVDLMIEVMKELTDYKFIVTADINKLSVEVRQSLQKLNNVILTGFLPVKEYHDYLCSSLATLVLTTSEATQPSGACEALSSDSQLIVSKTSLTENLFGEWAILVDNSQESIVKAIRSLSSKTFDLSSYRNQWNILVQQRISELVKFIGDCDREN